MSNKVTARLRPSPAMVVAFVALIVALGGTSYAVVRLPAKSVATKHLKSQAVSGSKIKNNAITGTKILNDSLTGDDIKESTLGQVVSAAKAADSDHAASAAAVDKLVYKSATKTIPAATPDPQDQANVITATAGGGVFCDPGQHVVGGGVKLDDVDNTALISSFPDAGGTSWFVYVGNDDTKPHNFTVYAVCLASAATG